MNCMSYVELNKLFLVALCPIEYLVRNNKSYLHFRYLLPLFVLSDKTGLGLLSVAGTG